MSRVLELGAHQVSTLDDFLSGSLGTDFSCDVVLDGIGGNAVQQATFPLMRREGHYCDLNGNAIRSIDEHGLVAGKGVHRACAGHLRKALRAIRR